MSFILGQKRFGIVFDLDNTLVPTAQCYNHACDAARMMLVDDFHLSKEISDSIVNRYHYLSYVEQPFHAQNKLSVWEWREDLFKQAVETFTANKSTVDVSVLHKHYHEVVLKGMVIPQKVQSLLRELRKKFKLGILTNGDSKHQWEKVKNCEAEMFVDTVVVSGDHDMYKPDPRIFCIVCRKLGLENRQCIMVGDLLSTDILGSQNAGFKGSILVEGRDIDRLHEIKPDHVISDVSQLKGVLETYQFS